MKPLQFAREIIERRQSFVVVNDLPQAFSKHGVNARAFAVRNRVADDGVSRRAIVLRFGLNHDDQGALVLAAAELSSSPARVKLHVRVM